ncbi:MAG: tRNA lysidine(34) synthetase TilS, partial [Paenisporosarcina sp.]|nr:tRNA lysidine(34) synthetase TilS [Paenisporosarcina sp.]
MDFRLEVLSYIDKHRLINEKDRLLVACSGGADSVALLLFLWNERKVLGIEIACIHANHGLRGTESDEDEDYVKQLCSELKIPFYHRTLAIQQLVKETKGNVQDICRQERYTYFKEIMEKHDYTTLAVAHHSDDQAETIIMRLTRGSKAIGMPIKRAFGSRKLIRPFLSVTRAHIENYLSVQQVSYREDSSNKKDTYTRNRIRHHILPLLQAENPSATTHMAQWAENQQLENTFLETLAEKECEEIIVKKFGSSFEVDLHRFQSIPTALQKRVILLLLNYLYPKQNMWFSQSLIDQIHDQCLEHDGSKEIALPNGGKVRRQYSMMLFSFPQEGLQNDLPLQEVMFGQWMDVGYDTRMRLEERQEEELDFDGAWYITLHQKEMPLSLRPKKDGDRLLLQGMTDSKRVSRMMIDEKVSRFHRDSYLVLVTKEEELLGLPGLRLGYRFS